MLLNSKSKYFNYPRFYNLNFYHIAAEKFIEKYLLHKDVISIYLFGHVSVEGVSDLDFLVVLQDPLTQPLNKKYSTMTFNKDLRYIYNNTQPFVVTEEVYKNFWKIFPTHNLKLIYGKEIKQECTDETKARLYNLLILIDVCNHFYPILFLKQLFSKKLNVRYSLLILNSLKFPLQLFMDICGCTYDSWDKFINQVKKLREHWFKTKDGERCQILHKTLQEASIVSIDLMDKLDNYIKQNLWGYSPKVSAEAICELKPLGRYFIAPFDKNMVLEDTINGFKRTENWSTFLPLTFYFPPLIYSLEDGLVSEHIRGSMPAKGDFFTIKDDRVRPYMKDRISLMNKHAAFYKDNGIEINMVHNYYGYNPLIADRKSFLLFVEIQHFFRHIVNVWRRRGI